MGRTPSTILLQKNVAFRSFVKMVAASQQPNSYQEFPKTYPLKINISPKKEQFQKENIVFQPSFFMGYSLVFGGVFAKDQEEHVFGNSDSWLPCCFWSQWFWVSNPTRCGFFLMFWMRRTMRMIREDHRKQNRIIMLLLMMLLVMTMTGMVVVMIMIIIIIVFAKISWCIDCCEQRHEQRHDCPRILWWEPLPWKHWRARLH